MGCLVVTSLVAGFAHLYVKHELQAMITREVKQLVARWNTSHPEVEACVKAEQIAVDILLYPCTCSIKRIPPRLQLYSKD